MRFTDKERLIDYSADAFGNVEWHTKRTIRLGDMVETVTTAFGIKPCAGCKKRQVILNKVGEQPITETIKQLKETF